MDQRARNITAKIEIGKTNITRRQKCVLIVAFFTIVFSVPVVQHIYEIRTFISGKSERLALWPQCYDIVGSVFRSIRITWFNEKNRGPDTKTLNSNSVIDRIFKANRALLHDINTYEDALTDDSFMTETLLPPAQSFLTGILGVGNEKAYLGKNRWLFYRPAIDYLIGAGFLDRKRLIARAMSGTEWQPAPQPDPMIAIFQFQKQLAARGIQLIVMPVPVKPMIQPEKFSIRYEQFNEVLQNPSYRKLKLELENPELFFKRYEEFLRSYRRVPVEKARRSWYWQFIEALEELQDAKEDILKNRVLLFDIGSDLAEQKKNSGMPQYLETDTHWRSETMRWAAIKLNDYVESNIKLSEKNPIKYTRISKGISNLGDIALMMKLPSGQKIFRRQEIDFYQVTRGNHLWRPDMTAEILLLGDSFSNVYSLNEMGWGEAGGFAEQLSYELKRPVDAIIRNDSGAYATREILSQELASGNDRLAGKKVVIWEFAVRELAVGDWRVKSTPMKLGQSIESHFLQVKVGSSHAVSGVVQEISSAPVPGTVPYRDHIIYIHLRDIESHDGVDLYSNQALVAMYSMRDQLWTKAARFRVGQKIQLRLLNYGEINQLYNVERINSSMLDSENAFETPCWGEELDASAQSASEPGNAIRMDSDFGVPELSGCVAVLIITMVIYSYLNRREDQSKRNKD
jgi:alginate O-acetyltransferase complex protein AlgJ